MAFAVFMVVVGVCNIPHLCLSVNPVDLNNPIDVTSAPSTSRAREVIVNNRKEVRLSYHDPRKLFRERMREREHMREINDSLYRSEMNDRLNLWNNPLNKNTRRPTNYLITGTTKNSFSDDRYRMNGNNNQQRIAIERKLEIEREVNKAIRRRERLLSYHNENLRRGGVSRNREHTFDRQIHDINDAKGYVDLDNRDRHKEGIFSREMQFSYTSRRHAKGRDNDGRFQKRISVAQNPDDLLLESKLGFYNKRNERRRDGTNGRKPPILIFERIPAHEFDSMKPYNRNKGKGSAHSNKSLRDGRRPGRDYNSYPGRYADKYPNWNPDHAYPDRRPDRYPGTNPGWHSDTNPGWNSQTNPDWNSQSLGWNSDTNVGWNSDTNPGWYSDTNPGWYSNSNPGSYQDRYPDRRPDRHEDQLSVVHDDIHDHDHIYTDGASPVDSAQTSYGDHDKYTYYETGPPIPVPDVLVPGEPLPHIIYDANEEDINQENNIAAKLALQQAIAISVMQQQAVAGLALDHQLRQMATMRGLQHAALLAEMEQTMVAAEIQQSAAAAAAAVTTIQLQHVASSNMEAALINDLDIRKNIENHEIIKHLIQAEVKDSISDHINRHIINEVIGSETLTSHVNRGELMNLLLMLRSQFSKGREGFTLSHSLPTISSPGVPLPTVPISEVTLSSFIASHTDLRPTSLAQPITLTSKPHQLVHLDENINMDGMPAGLDMDFYEHILSLPDDVFSDLINISKRDFILLMFPRLYSHLVKDHNLSSTTSHGTPLFSFSTPIPVTTPVPFSTSSHFTPVTFTTHRPITNTHRFTTPHHFSNIPVTTHRPFTTSSSFPDGIHQSGVAVFEHSTPPGIIHTKPGSSSYSTYDVPLHTHFKDNMQTTVKQHSYSYQDDRRNVNSFTTSNRIPWVDNGFTPLLHPTLYRATTPPHMHRPTPTRPHPWYRAPGATRTPGPFVIHRGTPASDTFKPPHISDHRGVSTYSTPLPSSVQLTSGFRPTFIATTQRPSVGYQQVGSHSTTIIPYTAPASNIHTTSNSHHYNTQPTKNPFSFKNYHSTTIQPFTKTTFFHTTIKPTIIDTTIKKPVHKHLHHHFYTTTQTPGQFHSTLSHPRVTTVKPSFAPPYNRTTVIRQSDPRIVIQEIIPALSTYHVKRPITVPFDSVEDNLIEEIFFDKNHKKISGAFHPSSVLPITTAGTLIGGFEGTLRPSSRFKHYNEVNKNREAIVNALPRIPGTDHNDDQHVLSPFEKRKGNSSSVEDLNNNESNKVTGLEHKYQEIPPIVNFAAPPLHSLDNIFKVKPVVVFPTTHSISLSPTPVISLDNNGPPKKDLVSFKIPSILDIFKSSNLTTPIRVPASRKPTPQKVDFNGLPSIAFPGLDSGDALAMVSPEELISRLPAHLRVAPPCAGSPTPIRSFCLMPHDYPRVEAELLSEQYKDELKKLKTLLENLEVPTLNLKEAAKQIPAIDASVTCEEEERTVSLGWARDVLGSWLAVLQTTALPQPITVRTCSASARAKGCRPLLRPRPLVAFHPENEHLRPLLATFPVPVTCVYATQQH